MKDKEIKKDARSLLTKLMSGDAKESSKRALAMYAVIILGTIITVASLWGGVDYIILLGVWLGFASTLLGMSEYNKSVAKKHDSEVKKAQIKYSNGGDSDSKEEIN